MDGLRKEDWLPRTKREKMKKLDMAIAKLEQKYLRNVTAEEISKETGLPKEEIQSLLNEYYFSNILSIDDYLQQNVNGQEKASFVIQDENMKTPEENVIHLERIQELVTAIQKLSKKEQIVLSLFYQEGLTLTEIGEVLNLTTSRISQIHSKAIKKLRTKLEEIPGFSL